MKLAKVSEETIQAMRNFFDELEEVLEGYSGDPGQAVAIAEVARSYPHRWGHVVFAYETLYENCCDPTLDYLEWKPEIKALIEGQQEDDRNAD